MRHLSRTFAVTAWTTFAVLYTATAQTVVNSTFLGGDFLYSNPANWSPAVVPNNTASRNYNVVAYERFFLDSNDATISNLTIGEWALSSMGPSLTVTGSTTIDRPAGSNITGVVNLFAINQPATFALGRLSTFANGVLTGGYFLAGPATLQFNGADVTALSGAAVTLESASRLVNENGMDGLRNLARIEADSALAMIGRQFFTAGNLTVDGMLSVHAGGGIPALFVITGLLTNFDQNSRTLGNGSYSINGDSSSATLQFFGADIVSNGATLSLTGVAAIGDEAGRDGLRNFSHNLATGKVSLFSRHLTIAGDFTNDGVLEAIRSSIAIGGTLTNYDAASKTLNGGTYRLTSVPNDPARLSFAGADIVHNNAFLAIGGGGTTGGVNGAITDGAGQDGLRNLSDNQAGGILEFNVPFTAASSFMNAGSVTLGPTSFTLPAGDVYRQTAGSTLLIATKLTGDVDLAGGELTSRAIPPSVRPPAPFPGATPTITGNLTVGAGVLKPTKLGVNGNVQLTSSSTLRYIADTADTINAGLNGSAAIALGGKLEVEYPSPFPPGSLAKFYVATAGAFTGAFNNVANGGRITTTNGAGSFLLSFNQNQMFLTDYQRATPAAQLLNISTRAQVLTGDDAPIGGFIIYGIDPKKIVLRAIGPSLTAEGVSGALQDPTLELHNSAGIVIATNNNWQDSQGAEISSAGLAPKDARESAIVMTLQPGAYTAVMRGANNTTGAALVEVYDLSGDAQSTLANISTRGFVGEGNVLIGGLIASGNGVANAHLVMRGIGGFSLEERGVPNPLPDPALELRDENGSLVAANDDFVTPSENGATMPRELQPRYDTDAALGVNVPPGNYTVIVYGKNGDSGNALVEIYDLNR